MIYVAVTTIEPLTLPSRPCRTALAEKIIAAQFQCLPVVSEITAAVSVDNLGRILAGSGRIGTNDVALDGGQRKHGCVVVVGVVAIFRFELNALAYFAHRGPVHRQRALVAMQAGSGKRPEARDSGIHCVWQKSIILPQPAV